MRALAAMSALALLVWTSPSSAITRKLSEQHPYIMDIAAGAESVMVFRLDSDPIPRCVWDFTDSLRFIHCYPILEMAPSPGKDWNKELGDLLGSVRMNSWNRDGCGYSPQAVVRFSDSVRTSNLVVFTGRCDSLKVGLLMIRTDRPLEYQEMAAGGGDLLDMLGYALSHAPLREAVPAESVPAEVRDEPSEGAFVYYDEAPKPLKQTDPVYPEFARVAQISGKVVLHVLVGEDGRVRNIKVYRGVTGLNQAAVECVRHWTFGPATAKGRPVPVWIEVPIDFHP